MRSGSPSPDRSPDLLFLDRDLGLGEKLDAPFDQLPPPFARDLAEHRRLKALVDDEEPRPHLELISFESQLGEGGAYEFESLSIDAANRPRDGGCSLTDR